jgi:hypothetical protein
MKLLRILSLPLLQRGDRMTNSITVWLVLAVCASIGAAFSGRWSMACAAVVCWLVFAFWFSARLQRELARRYLAEQCCPLCGEEVGKESAASAFDEFTENACHFIDQAQAKAAFSIEPGSPLPLTCLKCSQPLFFDYVDTRRLSTG